MNSDTPQKNKMGMILKISLLIILILYMAFFWKYLLFEEILGIFLIPIFVAAIIAGLCFLLIRIFKPIKYQKVFTVFLVVAYVLQLGILRVIYMNTSSPSYTKKQIVSDIDYAINMLEDVHPDPYSIIGKENFYRKVDSMKKVLPDIVSGMKAQKTFAKIYALIKDGHTGFNNFKFKPQKFLPYKFKIMDEKIFVAHNYCYRNVISIGSEIISINGMSAQQYIQEVEQLFGWENMPFRNESMIMQYPVFFELWDSFRNIKVVYKTPAKKIKTVRTSGGLISLLWMSKGNGQTKIPYQYKPISDNIGYIEFNSFTDLERFKVFLDSTFTTIKKKNVKHLIIDIRKNGGGNSTLGDELMQYISKTDFKHYDSIFVEISNELISKKRLEDIDSVERKPGTIWTTDETLIPLRDNPLRFNGKSYLLIGGNTFSSATSFTSAFQCFEVGAIIGTETGGLTVSFGDLYYFMLPETKFNMKVSHKKFYAACGIDNRRGIIPNYIAENTIEDEANSFDRVLEFTLDLISKDSINF